MAGVLRLKGPSAADVSVIRQRVQYALAYDIQSGGFWRHQELVRDQLAHEARLILEVAGLKGDARTIGDATWRYGYDILVSRCEACSPGQRFSHCRPTCLKFPKFHEDELMCGMPVANRLDLRGPGRSAPRWNLQYSEGGLILDDNFKRVRIDGASRIATRLLNKCGVSLSQRWANPRRYEREKEHLKVCREIAREQQEDRHPAFRARVARKVRLED